VAKKTADKPLSQQDVYDFCASIQYGVFRHVCYKVGKILEKYPVNDVLLGGGVSANATLRKMLRQTIKKHGLKLKVPYTKRLCMDNAAMIGLVAGMKATEQAQNFDRNPNLLLSGK
jgi:N6-L-threonylcarbamoyladenine synthase